MDILGFEIGIQMLVIRLEIFVILFIDIGRKFYYHDCHDRLTPTILHSSPAFIYPTLQPPRRSTRPRFQSASYDI